MLVSGRDYVNSHTLWVGTGIAVSDSVCGKLLVCCVRVWRVGLLERSLEESRAQKGPASVVAVSSWWSPAVAKRPAEESSVVNRAMEMHRKALEKVPYVSPEATRIGTVNLRKH